MITWPEGRTLTTASTRGVLRDLGERAAADLDEDRLELLSREFGLNRN
jgi:hypothetical protein